MDEQVQTLAPPEAGSADLVALLTRFEGTAEQFLHQLLVYQCRLTGAMAAAVLRATQPVLPESEQVEGADEAEEAPARPTQFQVIAAHPPMRQGTPPAPWLSAAAEGFGQLLQTEEPVASAVIEPSNWDADELGGVASDPAGAGDSYIVLVPLRNDRISDGVAAFWLRGGDEAQRNHIIKLLEMGAAMLCAYEMRLALHQRSQAMATIQQTMAVLADVNDQKRLNAAAMAFCNQMAARFHGERVTLGFLRGRYVKIQAMSHTERISRKMRVVQDLESVMEECLDQDVEIVHPAPPQASYVSKAAAEHSQRSGPFNICSLPIRRERKVGAVLTVERPADRPFTVDDVQRMRLACELCGARLLDLHEHDRWFGIRWANATRAYLATILSPKHTWAKVGALAGLAFLLFTIFAHGTFKIESPFVVEAIQQQIVPAPFDGYIKSVNVEPGELVTAHQTVLATLDDAPLRLERSALDAEVKSYRLEASVARQQGKPDEASIADRRADQAEAKMAVLDYKIRQSQIVSPISGVVLAGDLRKKIGAPVQTGDVLFEIAPRDAFRARLSVPDDKVVHLSEGSTGELAAGAHPGRYVRFVIERVNPIAEVQNSNNVFLARAKLVDVPADLPLLPGMEGVAKVHAGERPYIDLWTRDLINWIRMKLWL